MVAIEWVVAVLAARLPDAKLDLAPAATASGTWILDAQLDEQIAIVMWGEGRGFRITPMSNPAGHAEHFEDATQALERLTEILSPRAQISPKVVTGLSALRESRRITQVELANRLGVLQAAVSKLERRRDLRLSTLRGVVTALGGRLEVRAVFDERDVSVLDLDGGGSDAA